jgi:hypothetical protein
MTSLVQLTQPCCLLDIPPELPVILYKHIFDAIELKIQNKDEKETAQAIELYSKHMKHQPQILYVSRLILREASPIYECVLRNQIPSLNQSIRSLQGQERHIFEQYLRNFYRNMIKDLQGTTRWARHWQKVLIDLERMSRGQPKLVEHVYDSLKSLLDVYDAFDHMINHSSVQRSPGQRAFDVLQAHIDDIAIRRAKYQRETRLLWEIFPD